MALLQFHVCKNHMLCFLKNSTKKRFSNLLRFSLHILMIRSRQLNLCDPSLKYFLTVANEFSDASVSKHACFTFIIIILFLYNYLGLKSKIRRGMTFTVGLF